MTLRDELTALTPRLRRYARALATGHTAACQRADDLVHSTLIRALGARSVGSSDDLCIRLYATVTQLHREAAPARAPAMAASMGRPALVAGDQTLAPASRRTALSSGLLSLTLEEREALLLVALERFDHDQAARILRIPCGLLLGRLTRARTALDAYLSARPPQARTGRAVGHLRLVT